MAKPTPVPHFLPTPASSKSIKQFADNPQTYRLLLINARSIVNKISFLRDLSALETPHFILITETWATDDTQDIVLFINNYKLFRSDRTDRRGGGCIIYIHNSITATLINDPKLTGTHDSIWISTILSCTNLLLGCIYRPPNSSCSQSQELINVMHYASLLPQQCKIVAGDFNMPNVNWSVPSPDGRFSMFAYSVLSDGWIQHVEVPTRKTRILDLVFSCGLQSPIASVKNPLRGSDHNTILFTFCVPKTFTTNNKRLQKLHFCDIDQLSTAIRSTNWTEFFLAVDTETAANILYGHMNDFMKFISAESNRTTYPEHTPRTIQRKLKRLRRVYNQTADFSCLLQINRINIALQADHLRQTQLAEQRALDSKDKVHRLAKLYRLRTHSQQSATYLTLPDGTIVEGDKNICEAYSDYFSDSLITEPTCNIHEIPSSTCNTLSEISLSLDAISKSIKFVKPSLYPGPDGMPPALIRLSPDMPLLLLHLFNLSLTQSHFPQIWKVAVITPRHKGGASNDIKNYRPINHTPDVSKILERVVNDSIITFFTENNLLNPSQYGFLKNRSCVSCQLDFLDFVSKAVDDGLSLIVLFLDMQKAFDRVPHKRLIAKLSSMGIKSPLLCWLRSYLENRLQVVRFNDVISNPKPVTSGVIQGSVLGPTLFLTYVNDIFECFKHGRAFLFADDIKIVYTAPRDDLLTMFHDIKNELRALDSWSTFWCMNFSPNKCSVLNYRCNPPDSLFTINGSLIPRVEHVRDLGLRYSMTLNFSEQVAYQVSKARQSIHLICKNICLPEARLQLYKLIVRPLLEYCPVFFTNLRKSDKLAIESVQRSFSKRLIGWSTNMKYHERCVLLDLEPLWLRRIKIGLYLLFKIIHGLSFSNNKNLHFKSHPNYCLRNDSNILPVSRSRTKLRYDFFLNRYSSLWNTLPIYLRECTSFNHFKQEIEHFVTVNNLIAHFSPATSIDTVYSEGLFNF